MKDEPDDVGAPLLEGEMRSILEQADELRKSNTSYEENFDSLSEAGNISKEDYKRYSKSKAIFLALVLSTFTQAVVAGELDQLRQLIKSKINVKLGDDASLIRGLIRCARPDLSASTATKYAAAVRWALYCRCKPAEFPAFIRKEGYEKSYRKFVDLVKRERQPPKAKPKAAAPPKLTLQLGPKHARRTDRLTRSGKGRRMVLAVYWKDGKYEVLGVSRPDEEEWRAALAAAKRSTKRPAEEQPGS